MRAARSTWRRGAGSPRWAIAHGWEASIWSSPRRRRGRPPGQPRRPPARAERRMATARPSPAPTSMAGKRVLVTGANAGIGKWTAIGLAERGAAVVMHARNPEKGRAAKEEVERRSGAVVDLLLADFSSLAEVRRLAAEVLERYDRLDVLVNNAGLISGKRA